MKKVIGSINVKQFVNGWWGEHGEGKEPLRSLGVSEKTIPFNVELFLINGGTEFLDSAGETISIELKREDAYFDLIRIYRGKREKLRLYREWGAEDLDTILKLESYSLGECLRQIILGKSII